MRFPAPVRCQLPEGTLAASAVFRSSGVADVTLPIDSLEHDADAGVVTVRLSFTPAKVHFGSSLEVTVEPNLGLASASAFIARDGRALPSVDEVQRCAQPARTTSGLVICESRGVDGGVFVSRGTTSVAAFRLAENAKVAGDVVWLEQPVDGGRVLARYDASDAGLRLTATAPVFSSGWDLTYADDRRYYRGDVLALLTDAGEVHTTTTVSVAGAFARLADEREAWQFVLGARCRTDGGCETLPERASVIGIERDSVLVRKGGDVEIYARPFADDRRLASFTSPFSGEPHAGTGVMAAPFYDERRGTFLLQWWLDAGVPNITWFPNKNPLWLSDDAIAFETDAGVTRFIDLR